MGQHADLVRFARQRGLRHEDAEDTAQEALARAYAHRIFDQHPNPEAWLRTTTGNLAVSLARRASARDLPLEGLEVLSAERTDDAATWRLEAELALRALGNINPRYAELLAREELLGEDPQAVRKALGLNAVTHRRLRSRARAALRTEFLRLGGSPLGAAVLFGVVSGLGRLRKAALTPAAAVPLAAAMLTVPLVLPGDATFQPDSHVEKPSITPLVVDGGGDARRQSVVQAAANVVPPALGASVTTTEPTPRRQAVTPRVDVPCDPDVIAGVGACTSDKGLQESVPNYHKYTLRPGLAPEACTPVDCVEQPGIGSNHVAFVAACHAAPENPLADCYAATPPSPTTEEQ